MSNHLSLSDFWAKKMPLLLLTIFSLFALSPNLLADNPQNKEELEIDLNKLESNNKSCRISLVFNNQTEYFFQRFYMDLAFFDPQGVIAQRITIDAAPLRNQKISIKEFDVPDVNCPQIHRVLLNNISDCE